MNVREVSYLNPVVPILQPKKCVLIDVCMHVDMYVYSPLVVVVIVVV